MRHQIRRPPCRPVWAALLLLPLLVAPRAAGAGAGISKIAFSTTRYGDVHICLITPDGSLLTRVTQGATGGDGAILSPTGDQIAFESPRNGWAQLFVINTDGTGEHRLLSSSFYGQSATWSPDGARIAFVHSSNGGQPGGTGSLWVVKTDGTGMKKLSPTGADDWDPAWSPDGAKLAFAGAVGGHLEIFVMNADGSGRQQLTGGTAQRCGPRWSPDGACLACTLVPTPGDWSTSSVHVMLADGSGDVAVTDSLGTNLRPAWSPDGGRLAFSSSRNGPLELWTIARDGTDLQRVMPAAGSSVDFDGSWGVVTRPADVTPPATDPDLRWSVTSPARGTAFLRFSLPRDGETTVCLFDTVGRRVRTLLDGRLPAGAHTATWDGRDAAGRACPTGVYLAELAGTAGRRTARLVLLH